jgi:hypothetical protein
MKYALGKMTHWKEFAPIAQSSETYLALRCKVDDHVQIRFIDSLQFVISSLDNAAKQLSASEFILTKTLPFAANFRKAIFPYSYVDSFAKLEASSNSLPPYEDFHDILQKKNPVSLQEYSDANLTYQQWGCRCLKDYYQKYLMMDVYLLADVFQNFP